MGAQAHVQNQMDHWRLDEGLKTTVWRSSGGSMRSSAAARGVGAIYKLARRRKSDRCPRRCPRRARIWRAEAQGGSAALPGVFKVLKPSGSPVVAAPARALRRRRRTQLAPLCLTSINPPPQARSGDRRIPNPTTSKRLPGPRSAVVRALKFTVQHCERAAACSTSAFHGVRTSPLGGRLPSGAPPRGAGARGQNRDASALSGAESQLLEASYRLYGL